MLHLDGVPPAAKATVRVWSGVLVRVRSHVSPQRLATFATLATKPRMKTFLDGLCANAAQTANATAYCAPRPLATFKGSVHLEHVMVPVLVASAEIIYVLCIL